MNLRLAFLLIIPWFCTPELFSQVLREQYNTTKKSGLLKVYGKRLFELYVDGEIVERHVEPTEPVHRLALSAGDYFSKGKVEFSNLKIRESL